MSQQTATYPADSSTAPQASGSRRAAPPRKKAHCQARPFCENVKVYIGHSFYLLWICTLLMHPVVPSGCEMICDYLQLDPAEFFSWSHSFESMEELCSSEELASGAHAVKELPPRTDFFEAHPSQFK